MLRLQEHRKYSSHSPGCRPSSHHLGANLAHTHLGADLGTAAKKSQDFLETVWIGWRKELLLQSVRSPCAVTMSVGQQG